MSIAWLYSIGLVPYQTQVVSKTKELLHALSDKVDTTDTLSSSWHFLCNLIANLYNKVPSVCTLADHKGPTITTNARGFVCDTLCTTHMFGKLAQTCADQCFIQNTYVVPQTSDVGREALPTKCSGVCFHV